MKCNNNWIVNNLKIGILSIILLIFIAITIILGIKIVNWKIDNINTKRITEQMLSLKEEPTINGGVISINFDHLLKINKEVVGWLKVDHTNIDYPIVKHYDNDYYLTHSLDNSNNEAGWIYLDYRNNLENLNDNTIIYGHNRRDESMFGSLRKLLKDNFSNSNMGYNISLYTPSKNYFFRIFSVYRIKTTDDYISTNSNLKWINLIKSRSIYDFNIDVLEDDKILTLTTCYNNVYKLVVHAKLVSFN